MAKSTVARLMLDAPDFLLSDFRSLNNPITSGIAALHGRLVSPDQRGGVWRALDRPRELMSPYTTSRPGSELYQLLRRAAEFRDRVDRVVVIGSYAELSTIQVLKHACCDPYFNELTRGQRGSRPRMSFVDAAFDPDQIQGLLELVLHFPDSHDVNARWGILALGDDSATEPSQWDAMLRTLTDALMTHAGEANWRSRWLLVSPPTHPWFTWATKQGCPGLVSMPERDANSAGLSLPFSTGVLLATALLGIDVVKILEGAAQMSSDFLEQDVASEFPWRYAAVRCRQSLQAPRAEQWITAWSKSLEPFANWHLDCLMSQMPGEWSPLRYYHATEIPMLLDGRRPPALTVNVTAAETKSGGQRASDRPATGRAFDGVRESMHRRGCPFVEIRLPSVNEPSMGQLIQMMLISAIAESCLLPNGEQGELKGAG